MAIADPIRKYISGGARNTTPESKIDAIKGESKRKYYQ